MAAYNRPIDAMARVLPLDLVGIHSCAHRTGSGIESIPTDQCYRMRPIERVRGIWFDEFEGTRFYPNAMRVPARPRDEPGTWRLNYEPRGRPMTMDGKYNGRMVLVELVGRRTVYNVDTIFDQPIFVVDRLLYQRVLRPGRGDPGGPPLRH